MRQKFIYFVCFLEYILCKLEKMKIKALLFLCTSFLLPVIQQQNKKAISQSENRQFRHSIIYVCLCALNDLQQMLLRFELEDGPKNDCLIQ